MGPYAHQGKKVRHAGPRSRELKHRGSVLNLARMSAPEDKPKGFTVSDRRSFTESGERREEPAPAQAPAKGRLPPVDFPTFVLSIGSSALLHMGAGDEGTEGGAAAAAGTVTKDLALAKHTIDILAMLQEKTRGNLSSTEAELLENLLFDLRLRYVDAAKSK